HAPCEYLPLPRVRRHFKALHLLQHVQQSALTHLRARRYMLPSRKPVHEHGGRDRLDLFAQLAEGEPMDASEQSPVTPLFDASITEIGDGASASVNGVLAAGLCIVSFERSAQDSASDF